MIPTIIWRGGGFRRGSSESTVPNQKTHPGKTSPDGAPAKYSMLLHAEFQSKECTLRDDEVAQWSAQIVKALEALGGTLRS